MSVLTKICGITAPDALTAAIDGGAEFVGFVFYPPSPRCVSPGEVLRMTEARGISVRKVGLFVDPTNKELEDVLNRVPLEMIQLHGSESPDRATEIKMEFGLPIMKALSISNSKNVSKAMEFEGYADWIMFDAKAPRGSSRPGGNARSFDWGLLSAIDISVPWMLAGGLTAANICEAVTTSDAKAVDVSSGVESRVGQKDPKKISEFLAAVKTLT